MSYMLRVDMSTGEIKKEPVPEKYKYLGGRALITAIMSDETNPDIDPLGKDNKFIVCPGLLTGTVAPSSGRLSVGGKSPLTGTMKEANSGGIVSQKMAKAGIKAIIVENMPVAGKLFMLKIVNGEAELLPADEYAGVNNYELTDKLYTRFGNKIGIVSIGVAGERLYKAASVQVTSTNGYPARAAARGGVGALMGSKGLKAIVIEQEGTSAVEYADKAAFMSANKKFIEGILAHPVSGEGMPALGTAVLVNPVFATGCLPVNNFSSGKFAGVDKISGEHIAEMQASRGGKIGHACNAGCVIKCSNNIMDKNGEYLTSGFEYETVVLCGSNCGIDDLDIIATMDRMCDDIGIDTMDTGCAIAVAMEAGKAAFGDGEAALAMIREIKDGTEFGNILGNGTEATGKFLNVKRIPTVKGQALAAYDPRALKGTGVTYATSPMGADHTCGNTIGDPVLVPSEKEGQVEASGGLQVAMSTFDSLGICIFASMCIADPQYAVAVADMVSAFTGEAYTVETMMGIGAACLVQEKAYNRGAGIGPEADKLPDFFYNEPLDTTGSVFDFTQEELSKALPF